MGHLIDYLEALPLIKALEVVVIRDRLPFLSLEKYSKSIKLSVSYFTVYLGNGHKFSTFTMKKFEITGPEQWQKW